MWYFGVVLAWPSWLKQPFSLARIRYNIGSVEKVIESLKRKDKNNIKSEVRKFYKENEMRPRKKIIIY